MPPDARAASPRRLAVPTYASELELIGRLGGTGVVVGLDEVGRGALAGPVVVGACAVRIEDGRVRSRLPTAVRDSKALTARARHALVEPIEKGAHARGLGWASAAEIDERGIMAALTAAALRAIDALGVRPDAILLDGNVDLLSPHLCADADRPAPVVALRVAADRHCRSVAAASVLAKVARDGHMAELSALAPAYRWDANKGYASAAHREALARLGPHALHRRSWNLLGSAVPVPPADADVLWTMDHGGPTDRPDPDRQQEGTS